MDFAFVNAMNYIPLIISVLLLYDIMCQFWVHFLSRIAGYLQLDAPFAIKRGIGLFHVHGHIKECYPRYAPTFIPGAGMVDGEVIETLWNTLNHTASSARAMSWYHRQEYLDAHMADSNWKKLLRMGKLATLAERYLLFHLLIVPTLLRKWKACKDQVEDSEDYYQRLCHRIGPNRVRQYTNEETVMQNGRDTDVTVMDAMDVKGDKGMQLQHDRQSKHSIINLAPGRAEIQQQLSAKESATNSSLPQGAAAWLTYGLKLEEEQYVIDQHFSLFHSNVLTGLNFCDTPTRLAPDRRSNNNCPSRSAVAGCRQKLIRLFGVALRIRRQIHLTQITKSMMNGLMSTMLVTIYSPLELSPPISLLSSIRLTQNNNLFLFPRHSFRLPGRLFRNISRCLSMSFGLVKHATLCTTSASLSL